jgi:hypothetical protein
VDVRVTSHDGTAIAYERVGAGSAVILVGGGATDRLARIARPCLAEFFAG